MELLLRLVLQYVENKSPPIFSFFQLIPLAQNFLMAQFLFTPVGALFSPKIRRERMSASNAIQLLQSQSHYRDLQSAFIPTT